VYVTAASPVSSQTSPHCSRLRVQRLTRLVIETFVVDTIDGASEDRVVVTAEDRTPPAV
jgi:hypothetical protein